jgi:thiamine pyrophosphate-dependent acetolactate synthase large subunit-like protein
MVEGEIQIPIFTQPATFCPSFSEIKKAINIIGFAKKPLIIVGKGAAYGRAEK